MKYFTKVTFLHTSDHGEIVRICFILYSLTINHSFPLIAGNRGMSNVSCSQNSLKVTKRIYWQVRPWDESMQTNMAADGGGNERLNTGMAPTCNWRIKIVSN